MKNVNKLLAVFSLAFSLGSVCTEAAYDPVPVQKSVGSKVYIHLMPWFESKEFSGYWGGHWTMANQNPDVMDASGRRQIASYYYPLIGPYASADPDVIEYQLLLMKLSGVDGVLIDWPGTTNAFDYVRNRQNSEAIISKIAKVGLEFAVVYEDNNLTLANVPDKVGQARADMTYLRDNYFNKPEYIKINNQPLLLDFGPQTIQNANDWTTVFAPLTAKPYFLTLWYEHADAGANSFGEFAWVYQDSTPYLTHLTNFYQNATNYGLKMGAVAPGFNAFYAAGGWGSNPFTIDHNGLNTFKATLDLAINNNSPRFQVATWNDYGEGTNIEPTREFGYGYLTYMQQRLGVSNLGQSELELVNDLFNQRKQYKGNANEQARLDNVFYYLVSLQINSARNLLGGVSVSSSSSSSVKSSSSSVVSSSSSSVSSAAPNCAAPVVAYSANAPVVDGQADAVWSGVPATAINNLTFGTRTAGLSGKWRAIATADKLYVLVEVNDANLQNDSAANWWEDDTVELFIDGDNSKKSTYDHANDFQLGFRWNDSVVKAGGNSVTNLTGIVQSQFRTATGYNIEISIPWNTVGVTPRVGSVIGFDVAIDDDFNGGTRDSQLTSISTSGSAWSDTSVFGSIPVATCAGGSSSSVTSVATSKSTSSSSSSSRISSIASSSSSSKSSAAPSSVSSSSSSSRSSSSVNSSVGVTSYRIINRWKNTVLCDSGDYVSYAATSSGAACQWITESVGNGFIEIRNQATGDYMHIENMTGKVQATTRTSGWDSSRWQLENTDSGFVRVRNRWQPSQYIHVENQLGTAQHGVISPDWWSAQWKLEAAQ